MPRTGENIYERKDGRFEARFIAGRDENGKAKYASVYGRSKAEVREKMEAAKREIYGDDASHKDKTFREVAEEWLETNRDLMAATTYDRYRDTLERDVFPEYEDTPMSDVTASEVNRFLKRAPGLAAQRGRTLKESALQIVKSVMSNVIQYADAESYGDMADLSREVISYEELQPDEIERICLRAKHNHCAEMLATLLSIYCGFRIGELCGLKCDDVDLDRMEIYIHSTVHRVRNRDEDSVKKTMIVVEELPRKKQIRKVKIPGILKDYISEFIIPGYMLIRLKAEQDKEPTDPRTLEIRLFRAMDAFGFKNITFERLRKTYMNGKADEEILNNTFLGIRPDRPYDGAVDKEWLIEEMKRDLQPMRLLLGLSLGDMGSILGVSEATYRSYENGSKELSWDQYMALLFLFHYNGRTMDVSEALGLFPQALKEKMKIGG